VARPPIYDAVQALLGSRRCYARLRSLLPATDGLRVLDVGGGTGPGLAILGSSAHYLCVDTDVAKLSRLRRKDRRAAVVRADARALPVRSGEADLALCVFVCHHLDDEVLRMALREMARSCRGRTFIMEPLWVAARTASAVLWKYDQGAYPRTRETLLAEIGRCFELERVEEFAVFHRYVICKCRPL
jgi:ubiquinone/menaquinone biosynthesis C-methylase UbiE